MIFVILIFLVIVLIAVVFLIAELVFIVALLTGVALTGVIIPALRLVAINFKMGGLSELYLAHGGRGRHIALSSTSRIRREDDAIRG